MSDRVGWGWAGLDGGRVGWAGLVGWAGWGLMRRTLRGTTRQDGLGPMQRHAPGELGLVGV